MFKINNIVKRELVDELTGRIVFETQIEDQDFIDTNIRELYKDRGECKIYDITKIKYRLLCDVNRLSGEVKSITINISDSKRYNSVLTVSINGKKAIIDNVNITLVGDCLIDASEKVSLICNFSEEYTNATVCTILEELNHATLRKLIALESVGSTSSLYEKVSDVLLKELQHMLPFNDISIWRDSSMSKEMLPRKHRTIRINIVYKNLIYKIVDIPITIDIYKEKDASVSLYKFRGIKYGTLCNDTLSLHESEIKVLRHIL